MDGTLPALMVLLALGLTLGFAPPKQAVAGVLLALISSLSMRVLLSHPFSAVGVMLCWVAIAIIAPLVYWPRFGSLASITLLSIAAGLVSGLSLSGSTASTAIQTCWALIVTLPAWFAVKYGYAVAPRVVMSWLLGVTLLAAALPFVVTHPGYVDDHRG